MGQNGPPPRSQLNRNVPVSPPPPIRRMPLDAAPKPPEKPPEDGTGTFIAGVVAGAILF